MNAKADLLRVFGQIDTGAFLDTTVDHARKVADEARAELDADEEDE